MKKNSFRYIGLISLTSFAITACGGGSDSQTDDLPDTNAPTVPSNPTLPTTPPKTTQKNIIDFPASQFKIISISLGPSSTIHSVAENIKTQINNILSENIHSLYTQNSQYDFSWNFQRDNILTKDNLYTSKDGTFPQYILQNTDSKIILAYDNSTQSLTNTITFKNIDLSNEKLSSAKVTTDLFNMMIDNSDTNLNTIKNAISELQTTFEPGAICHQYLTQQFNQPNIIFGSFSSSQTIEQWATDETAKGNTVKQDTWANFKVAYVTSDPNSNHHRDLGYRTDAAIIMDGKLYTGLYDAGKLQQARDNYESVNQFSNGICNLYNKSAANTLRTAIEKLPTP